MEIRKCEKCGAFIMSGSDLCTSCAKKISYENTVLKNYFDENISFESIPSISAATGIEPGVVQNYMQMNHYIDSEVDNPNTFSHIQY